MTIARKLLVVTACVVSTVTLAADVTVTVDCGGGRSSGGQYVNDGSVGGFGGVSVPGAQVARHGFAGQLTEPVSLVITASPSSVAEGETSWLTGTATLDDETVTALTGLDITWGLYAYPIASISPSGLATAALVYSNVTGTINGTYLGIRGNGTLLVLDSIPDNYGTYAGDGLPDWWQNQFFGLDSPNAAPGKDVTGTGQNNLFKYTAGLDPTNAASVFRLRIANVPGQPGQKHLIFSPRWTDRVYTPEFRTNLVGGATWTNLSTSLVGDSGIERTVTDANAVEKTKFYRIRITLP